MGDDLAALPRDGSRRVASRAHGRPSWMSPASDCASHGRVWRARRGGPLQDYLKQQSSAIMYCSAFRDVLRFIFPRDIAMQKNQSALKNRMTTSYLDTIEICPDIVLFLSEIKPWNRHGSTSLFMSTSNKGIQDNDRQDL
jgi:hypothetical protein